MIKAALEHGREATDEYTLIIDGMIAAIVSCKKYKEKRATEPLTSWVTVSDETFLLLCLDNYSHKWRYEKRKKEGRLEEGEKELKALFTGKGQGSKKGWDERAMNVFNKTMRKVWTDRATNGKKFDDHFLKYMEFVHQTPVKGKQVGGDEAGALASTSPIILSDFNIESVMAQEYKERNKPNRKGSGSREEIMAGNLCDDDDNANDSDDDEIVYSDNNDNDNDNNDDNNDDKEDDNDEMSSGSMHEV